MNNVFPESMNPLPDDPKQAVKVMEKYIHYMCERMDFALSGGLRGGLRGVEQLSKEVNTIEGNIVTINGNIADINEDIGDIGGDITTINNNITTINGDITDIEGDITTINGSISTINTSLGNKVDKVSGKGLSTNDYTTTEKNKLAGIAEGANKTVVDSARSTTSTNPLQNKVIDSALTSLNTSISTTNSNLSAKIKTDSGSKAYNLTEAFAWKYTGVSFTVPSGYVAVMTVRVNADCDGLSLSTSNTSATTGNRIILCGSWTRAFTTTGNAATYYIWVKRTTTGSSTYYWQYIAFKA